MVDFSLVHTGVTISINRTQFAKFSASSRDVPTRKVTVRYYSDTQSTNGWLILSQLENDFVPTMVLY